MTKKYYCTLDTETYGGANKPKGIYHLGGVVHDRTGAIIGCFNYLIGEHFDQISLDDYAKKNIDVYLEMLVNGDATLIDTEENAIQTVKNLLDFYNVSTVMAFNSGFDFEKTKCKELAEGRNFIDLWLMALETICQKESYKEFCGQSNRTTASGNCKTNAETVYAYLRNDPDYKEEHTALEDSIIELEIFKACIKTHKRYTQNQHVNDNQNWYMLLPKAKEMIK